jgi:membrane protease YdiL (CAAX protease family)
MPTVLDHLLFIVLAVLFPLRAGLFGFRRIQLASPEERPRVRRSVYRQAIAIQWTLVLVALVLWVAYRRAWDSIGLVPRFGWGLAGVTVGMIAAGLAVMRQRRHALADDEALASLRERMGRLEPMLPHTREELALFFKLSVTAGICEELLYRGYIIWYLSHWFAIWPAAALSALVFGVGHAYQGWRGVITTGFVGAFLAAVYNLTGSLYSGMVMHALMDAHSGHLLQRAYERESAPGAAGEIAAHETTAGPTLTAGAGDGRELSREESS